MPQLFKIQGLNLRRSYLSWRKRYERGALLRYYVDKPGDDTRSVLGKGLDMLACLVLVWLTGFLLIFSLTGEAFTALVISVPLSLAWAWLTKKISKLGEQKRRLQRKIWTAGQKIMEDISKMNSGDEFVPYVRDILSGLPGFRESGGKIKRRRPVAGKNDGIDLECLYNGVPLAVSCRLQRDKNNGKAGPADIRDFAAALQLAGYKNGLYITSGDFDSGVLSVVREAARKGINIKLANRYRLMELARQAGFGAFGTEDGWQPAGKEKYRQWAGAGSFWEFAFTSGKKARNYLLYGFLLYGGYALLKGATPLSLVYLFFAVINFAAGIYSFIYCKTLEGADPLEGLETEGRR